MRYLIKVNTHKELFEGLFGDDSSPIKYKRKKCGLYEFEIDVKTRKKDEFISILSFFVSFTNYEDLLDKEMVKRQLSKDESLLIRNQLLHSFEDNDYHILLTNVLLRDRLIIQDNSEFLLFDVDQFKLFNLKAMIDDIVLDVNEILDLFQEGQEIDFEELNQEMIDFLKEEGRYLSGLHTIHLFSSDSQVKVIGEVEGNNEKETGENVHLPLDSKFIDYLFDGSVSVVNHEKLEGVGEDIMLSVWTSVLLFPVTKIVLHEPLEEEKSHLLDLEKYLINIPSLVPYRIERCSKMGCGFCV